MGLSRVFQRSVRFTIRSKRRFLVFLVIFAIVSTVIALNVDSLDTLVTDDLLQQKGVTVEKVENIDIPYEQGLALYEDILDYADSTSDFNIEQSAMYTYADVDDILRIHSIDIESPWISKFLTPSFIVDGRYPSAPNEIVVPDGASQNRNLSISNNAAVTSDLAVGQVLTMVNGEDKIQLEIVGKFDSDEYRITNVNDSMWLFMDNSMFQDILDLFDITNDNVFVYSEAFIVEGLVLQQETYQAANAMKEQIQEYLTNEARYGDWQDVPSSSLPLAQTKERSDQFLLTMAFTIFGGVILSTLFAYLISRFRRREIAILKAMGYGHAAVRTSLFAEILTTSFSGFLLGLGVAQGYLVYSSDFKFNNLIRWQAIGLSFLTMVIVSLPGMWLASRRILSVSPAEAFRDN